ncbi:DUF3935 domain-containing protein [uncultured Rossellomorea sp.]|uniref:DUF3935 domain-containing protein n=1 Tax=uncultured Rossellomorea sp. TaxID=2837549 RepID=UPI00262B539C|nr:DUF3935 domain-containing protein [uncultured Rossellomorea sp.]
MIKMFILYVLSFIGFYLGFILLSSLAENYNISSLYVVHVKEDGVEIFPTTNPFLIMFLYTIGCHKLISRMIDKNDKKM